MFLVRGLCLALTFFLTATSAFSQGKKGNPNIADTDPLFPEEQLKKFRLPPGFAIQLVAAEPKIKKPINIAFDAMGRLWVTGSEEYPFAAPPDRPGKDTAKILADFDDKGLARSVTTYADGLNIPIGLLPIPGGALIYSIPNIYSMPEKDGKADRRDILYTQFGFKDTHGMTGEFMRGFDGWVYCCHGFSNTSNVKGKGPEAISMTSGNTYRIKLDGSRIEPFTRGQVNPFGLCFDSWGNLFSADCHTRPLYQLLKGGHYPSFGKPHDGLGYAPEMVTHDHRSTAIAGIVRYEDNRFPEEFQGNIFVGNVVTNRINRDRLDPHGSTLKGIEMPDFVSCDDPWFRPVDIKLGPDGALYVADFYNRIIGHYEVDLKHPGRDREKGRIWRIVPVDENGKPKLHPVVNLPKASSKELIAALGHSNLTVRMDAIHELVHRNNAEATAALLHDADQGSAYQKVGRLWALERLGKLDEANLSKAAHDGDALVRTHALRIMSEREPWKVNERTLTISALRDANAFVQRAAVQGLAAHPDPEDVAPLLALRHTVPAKDTHLLHTVRMALRDQFRHPTTASAILAQSWSEADAAALADVCPGVQGEPAAKFLTLQLKNKAESILARKENLHAIMRFGSADERGLALAAIRQSFAKDKAGQAGMLKVMQQAMQERGEKIGPMEIAWASKIVQQLLTVNQPAKVQEGVDLAAAMRLTETLPGLLNLARAKETNAKLRSSAITALVLIDPAKSQGPLAAILLDDTEDLAVREQIAQALAGTNQAQAHEVLIQALSKAPARLQSTIALGMAGSPQGGEKLLDAVKTGKASPRLLQDRGIVLKLGLTKIANLDQKVATLTKGLPAADQRILELIAQRKKGFEAEKWDVAQGQAVFQKHCAACHQISNQGAKIGPQLDGVGIRGVDRLLEDILDPNRNVDQAFRSTTLELDNGQFLTGLLLREEGQILVMADPQGKEIRIPKTSVTQRNVGPLSPMPANILEQIPEADFHRLLAFLLDQRAKK